MCCCLLVYISQKHHSITVRRLDIYGPYLAIVPPYPLDGEWTRTFETATHFQPDLQYICLSCMSLFFETSLSQSQRGPHSTYKREACIETQRYAARGAL